MSNMLQIHHIGANNGTSIPGWPERSTIDGLIDALSRWELDPRLDYSQDTRFEPHADRKPYRSPALRGRGKEWCGEIGGYRYPDGPPIHPEHPTAVTYVGNFVGYSFAFNLTTDDRELIARLDQAIAQNIERHRGADRMATVQSNGASGTMRDSEASDITGGDAHVEQAEVLAPRPRAGG